MDILKAIGHLEAAGIGFEKHRDNKSSTIRLYRLDLPTPLTPLTQPLHRNEYGGVSKNKLPTPEQLTYTAPTPPEPLQHKEYVGSVGSVGKKTLSQEVSKEWSVVV